MPSSPAPVQVMAPEVTLDAFLRLDSATQERFLATARAKRETTALHLRLPSIFDTGALERICVSPTLSPFFTKFQRCEGMHGGFVTVYRYSISLDIDCVGGQKKTLKLSLEFWRIMMDQLSGAADSSNHELNIQYDGVDATAFSGSYGDCGTEDENKWVSESVKIQKVLCTLMRDCGVDYKPNDNTPSKKQKGKKPKVQKKTDATSSGSDSDESPEAFPDVVDAQCMEVLEAILGPSGKQVLEQDGYEPVWTMMKIIQKGRLLDEMYGIIVSYLRSTPAPEDYGIELPQDEWEDCVYSD
ncbi:hypothetical protein CYLTODRAFT_26345 [Cylindrobasidium torrendii FP15055 ss-10]|uniref:Uncharacterized protein n=1 Tax=Cylindrobasidium torrendii FP15055 ss-10 TaxID=1314674 RepID=A0A0D7B902_9AGAR|nr:hypothetical protein CYLTODRAFT_26345 [Cylindrobasidium torrendii FP15055 ss-10]